MYLSLTTLVSLLTLSSATPIPSANPSPRDVMVVEERETPLNFFLTILLANLPLVGGTIDAVAGILTTFEALLTTLTGEQTTYNELGGTCKEYTVIFARGTTEPGNVGILVGPPFFDALKDAVGDSNVMIQGVNNYDASVTEYIAGGDPVGSISMAAEIQSAYSSCPTTKLVASGYSQGGQIVHNAIALLSATTAEWISKVVIFGDPDNGQALPNVDNSKVDVYCNVGDDICLNGDLILPAHLIYAENAAAAAAFVAS